MFVKVIKESVIYNKKIYGKDDSFEINDNIGKSLIERGYVKEVDAEEKDVLTGEVDNSQLNELSYQELKALASQNGLSAKGTKDELIARIRESAEAIPEATEPKEEEIADDDISGDLPNTSMPE